MPTLDEFVAAQDAAFYAPSGRPEHLMAPTVLRWRLEDAERGKRYFTALNQIIGSTECEWAREVAKKALGVNEQ